MGFKFAYFRGVVFRNEVECSAGRDVLSGSEYVKGPLEDYVPSETSTLPPDYVSEP
jgi:hypothetical protein